MYLCGGDQEEASLLGSVPAVVTTWGMNHQMEDHFLCLSFCFHKICISNKNKCFLKELPSEKNVEIAGAAGWRESAVWIWTCGFCDSFLMSKRSGRIVFGV